MTNQRELRLSGQRRVGRPALVEGEESVRLMARVPAEFKREVHQFAEDNGISVGQLVRDALTEHMEKATD